MKSTNKYKKSDSSLSTNQTTFNCYYTTITIINMYHLLFVYLLLFKHYCLAVNLNDGGDDITFPDELVVEDNFHSERKHNNGLQKDQFGNSSLQIPLDVIQKINHYNVSDLLLHFVEGVQEDSPFLQGAAKIPEYAKCMPEVKTIELRQSAASNIVFIPQCTRVERCGGCCGHSLLACQPVETETLSFKVAKVKFLGSHKFQLLNYEIIQVEKHTKCQCGCKIKAENCTKFHVYNQALCSCECLNRDEQRKCYDKENKFWNPDLCTCQCIDIKQCSTGYTFDENTCHCMANIKRRFANNNKFKVKEEIDVVPLS